MWYVIYYTHSLEDNHTLEKLQLCGLEYDYYIRAMQSQNRMTMQLACKQLSIVGHRQVEGATNLGNVLRRNTSLKHLTLFLHLCSDELHDIIHSLEDNHTLETLVLPCEYQTEDLPRPRISWRSSPPNNGSTCTSP